MSFARIKESIITAGRRTLKVINFGAAKTAHQINPFGEDSVPVENMIAVYGKTANIKDPVIIGYINENQISAPGEKRIFSLDSDGDVAFSIHLKNNGTCEIGGNSDFAVRFNALNNSLQQQKDSINQELSKIQSAILGVGGTYVKQNISIDITAAKINEIKTS